MHQNFSVSRQRREFRGTGSLNKRIQMVIFSSVRDGVIMKKGEPVQSTGLALEEETGQFGPTRPVQGAQNP